MKPCFFTRGKALFQKSKATISEHISHIFQAGKLSEESEESVVRKFRITAADGKSYATNRYGLDAIIPVGYRVNLEWVTQVLREFAIR